MHGFNTYITNNMFGYEVEVKQLTQKFDNVCVRARARARARVRARVCVCVCMCV